ncbi:MAG: hypothetical protein ACR650_05830 [Methylocystis sp.]
MSDTVVFHVAHATPRRLRLRAQAKRGDQAYFRAVRDQLSQWPNVERVDVNPSSTSVVIHCADTGAFLRALTTSDLLRIVETPVWEEATQSQKRSPSWPFPRLDRQIQTWSGGRVDAARISVFVVVGVSVALKLARGNNFGAATVLLLYGGRAAQRWWLSKNAGESRANPERLLLPSGGV